MKSSKPSFSRRMDLLAALALMAIFLLAGWKIASRLPAPDFLLLSRQKASATRVLPIAQATASAALVPVRQHSPDGRFDFDARFVTSTPGQAVHAASLVELLDGRLRAVWFSGSREGARDVVIKTSVMDTESLRWSEETTLLDRQHLQQGLWRYVKKIGNPVIARMPDDSLMLWMVNVSVGGWAGSSITWLRSTDEGLSWGIPRRLVTSPFLNISTLAKGAPFFYQDGQIGLPVYHEFVTKFAEILRISPEGRVLDKVRVPGSQTSLQPVVLVSSASQAQIYMRSGLSTTVMASETADAGKTWSATHATAWPNPDSALAGVVTPAGQQWLALNPKPKNREMLTLLQASATGSFEGAIPWVVESSPTPETFLPVSNYERLLSDELQKQGASQAQIQADVASAKRQLCGPATCLQEFSYPYLLQGRDGYLHLVYTWHRSRIKHVRLDPMQALQPDAASPAQSHAASAAY
ncbi:exo-alpha-sialidase [Polaromonas sp. CG_9.11]|uniref:sialidase family protein n=1 Tax=Polaromonas sp. CG_9.11 TaxID=2787730 RepID=UPI001A303090|nr:sialidase family protein [Polaromonas sp. CG_9.11]MBG6077709.1 putative neuraminidase [Polaromonas sp. CG_9.11]